MSTKTPLIEKIVAVLAVLIILLATPVLAAPSFSELNFVSGSESQQFEAQMSASPDAIVTWNAIALRTAIHVAVQNQPQSQMYLAQIQAAVYNAAVAIEGGYQPYKANLSPKPVASMDRAAAPPAYLMLVHHFPAQQAELNADYAAALSAIPDGPAKEPGVGVGEEAAAE